MRDGEKMALESSKTSEISNEVMVKLKQDDY